MSEPTGKNQQPFSTVTANDKKVFADMLSVIETIRTDITAGKNPTKKDVAALSKRLGDLLGKAVPMAHW